ncbi:MAG: amidohydrolase [Myxococcota bacterium]
MPFRLTTSVEDRRDCQSAADGPRAAADGAAILAGAGPDAEVGDEDGADDGDDARQPAAAQIMKQRIVRTDFDYTCLLFRRLRGDIIRSVYGPFPVSLSNRFRNLVLPSLLVGVGGCTSAATPGPLPSSAPQSASLVLRGGTVVTVDETKPRAQAVAVVGERIAAVGSNDEITSWIGPTTTVIELDGRTAIPGFIEGHGHFLSLGFSRMQLDLTQVDSWEKIVAMVKEAASRAQPGAWIFGRGWHQAKWTSVPASSVEGVPTHDALSAASPQNPVFLGHASGHAAFVNAAAMDRAGIDKNTPNPIGGTIVRDAKGRPTGMLRETAQKIAAAAFAKRDDALERKKAKLAAEECLAKGVTSFQDAGSSVADIELFRELAQKDRLGVRLWVMLGRDIPNAQLKDILPKIKYRDTEHHRLTVAAIKRMIDGALGSHGALLLAPYTDMPSSTGLQIDSSESLAQTAALARQHGFQLCTHAIGDRGNRTMLDIYEKALGPDAAKSDHRWRIEHAQHLNPVDVPRFAALGIIASMQSVHCTSDGPWVPERLGTERAQQTSYLWKTLIDSGAVVTNGTDTPVEDVDPLRNYHAAVTRMMKTGEAFFPEQVMTRDQALRSYTLDAAYSAFEDDIKGSLTVGKLADITVLSQDITTVPAEQILRTKVMTTIVGGEVRYEAR